MPVGTVEGGIGSNEAVEAPQFELDNNVRIPVELPHIPEETHFIDSETAESLNPETRDTKFKVDYLTEAREAAIKEVESRYKIDSENTSTVGKLRNLVGKTKAYFAGEYADVRRSERNVRDEAEKGGNAFEEVKTSWMDAAEEVNRIYYKILGKTALTGGIGGLITVGIFGGSLAAPAFTGALIGTAAARGLVEAWRFVNPEEREARFKVMSTQQRVMADALRMQQEAEPFVAEYETATPERKAELEQYFAKQREYFVRLTNFKSFEDLDPQPEQTEENERPAFTLADVSEQAKEKNILERKREKTADLAAAFGSLAGGIVAGSTVHGLLAGETSKQAGTHIEKAKGFFANYDPDTISHFVQHITPDNIAHSDAGFNKLLEQSGGYVFNYNQSGHGTITEALKFAHEHGYKLTTALLKDGSQVHVLNGLSDKLFQSSLPHTQEIVVRAAGIAGNFYKEAVPTIVANLALWLSTFKGSHSNEPVPPNNSRQTVSVPVTYTSNTVVHESEEATPVTELTEDKEEQPLYIEADSTTPDLPKVKNVEPDSRSVEIKSEPPTVTVTTEPKHFESPDKTSTKDKTVAAPSNRKKEVDIFDAPKQLEKSSAPIKKDAKEITKLTEASLGSIKIGDKITLIRPEPGTLGETMFNRIAKNVGLVGDKITVEVSSIDRKKDKEVVKLKTKSGSPYPTAYSVLLSIANAGQEKPME